MGKKTFKNNPALQFISTPAPASDSEPEALSTFENEQPPKPNKQTVPEGMKINPLYIEKRSKRAQLVIQPSVYEKAKELAKSRGISFNDLVHSLLENEIERTETND